MRKESATPDQRVAALAARQHGVVTSAQLAAAGLGASGVSRRAKAGRLHRIHRGVYAVGHEHLSDEGRWLAAVLACGKRAVLGYLSAAALWRMLPRHAGQVEVSLPGDTGRRRQRGIRLRRCPTLTAGQVTRHHGIPVTTPARTLVDIRRVLPRDRLREAVRQAEVLRLPIGDASESDGTRSELEHLFLQLCGRNGLPKPQVNVPVGPFMVDFLWAERKVIVETDGYRYHGGRAAFEQDRARDLRLKTMGYDVVRLSYEQIVDHPDSVVQGLRIVLAL
jgi:very-short-patch-repair endonuclease